MTLNEALIRQTFIIHLIIKDGKSELSKDLKVKIMNMRVVLNRLRAEFEDACVKKIEELQSEEFKELAQIQNKSSEEESRFQLSLDKLNADYDDFVTAQGLSQVSFDTKFTWEEYEDIIEVNAGINPEIDGKILNALDFLEIIYNLFVE